MIVGLVVLGLALFGLAAAAGWGISAYNGLVSLKNAIELAWSNIDVLLKQRHDELGKLIEVVKGARDFEQQTLQRVIEARARFGEAGNRTQEIMASGAVSSALRGLFAVAESYPDLKASENFRQLQARIGELENALADRREGYNDTVNLFNTRIEQFPDNWVASMMSLRRREYFRADGADTHDVAVSFQ